MGQPTIFDIIDPPAPGTVGFRLLAGPTGDPTMISATTRSLFEPPVVPIDPTSGRWESSALTPNSLIDIPAGTVWEATVYATGRRYERLVFIAPDDDDEHWVGALLTDLPGALPTSALAAEVVAREEADTAIAAAVTAETTRATTAEGLAAQKAANLSDLADALQARANLGLGTAAVADKVAAGAAGVLDATDPTTTNTRIPTDGSVTDAKVAAGAAIAPSKIAGTAVVATQVGQPSGVASLDSAGLVPVAQIPPLAISEGLLSLRRDFGLDPSMSVGTLTTAIQNAIDAAVAAGEGIDLGADLWPINAALTIGGSITIRGVGAGEVWDTVQHSELTTVPGAAPWVKGGGFVQKTAATNILNITATGPTIHLRDLVLRFDDTIAFTNTGHAVYAVPTALASGQPENGPAGCRWDNIVVWGHDGNHYAFYTVNMNLFTATQLRSYGGGGWYEEVNSAVSAYGNGTVEQSYHALFAPGTADGFYMKSGSATFPGDLNLVTFVRPQCNIVNVTGSPIGAAYGIVSAPNASQRPYREVGTPAQINLIGPDFEPPSSLVVIGSRTLVVGSELSSRAGLNNTTIGVGALPGTPTGIRNTAVGAGALGVADTAATLNTAVGYLALAVATGSSNTAVGASALAANTTGTNNTAVGSTALAANTTATFSTAVGYAALAANTTGITNVAVGASALAANTTVSQLVAVGASALAANTTGTLNTAVGYRALAANTTASQNTAVGNIALTANTTGAQNTAVGYSALSHLTTGNGNVAVGLVAASAATIASNNTAVGTSALTALTTGNTNCGIGASALQSLTTGTNNTGLGPQAGRSIVVGSGNTALGDHAGYTDGTTATTDNSNMTLLGENAQATTGNVIVLGKAIATRPNLIFGGVGATAAFGGGVGVFHIANAVTPPGSNPVGGGILYVTGGALTYRGSSGTVTTLAPA